MYWTVHQVMYNQNDLAYQNPKKLLQMDASFLILKLSYCNYAVY